MRFSTFLDSLQVLLRCANTSPRRGGGGVCVYFLKSVRKSRFRNVWVWGGGGRCSHFSTQSCTLDGAHKHALQSHQVYSESSSSVALPFSGKAGTPLGQTSPHLWTGTYFFNLSQPRGLRSFSGTHPVLRGIAHLPSVVRSTFRCFVKEWPH